MKYSEAEEQIEQLSNRYSVEMNGKDFYVVYDGELRVAYVDGINKYGLHAGCGVFLNMPANDELFMILAHLAKTPLDNRTDEMKCYVYALKGPSGYLCISPSNEVLFTDRYIRFYKCKFTELEIEKLKRRDDVPLDWHKVRLEEAK